MKKHVNILIIFSFLYSRCFVYITWPITVMGGALFGPVFGTIYTVFAASIALGLSFLISRYVFRSLVVSKFGDNEAFKKIDAGVKQEAWRIIVFTRLVPVFSFSIQNYIYGLININFLLYWILSTIFIILGTLAYTMSVGAVLSNEFSTRNLVYFSIGVVTFLLVSIIPSVMKRRCHK